MFSNYTICQKVNNTACTQMCSTPTFDQAQYQHFTCKQLQLSPHRCQHHIPQQHDGCLMLLRPTEIDVNSGQG